MADPIIACFKEEFDRFQGLIEQQIDACPSEAAWVEKTGTTAYWAHIMHALGIVEYYALPLGAAPKQTVYSADEVRLKVEPHRVMSRDEMRKLAADMRQLAHAFLDSLSTADLPGKNEGMSKAMGRECTNIQAVIGLVRHYNYHIGCLDSILRAKGLLGVY